MVCPSKQITLGFSGASGAPYGWRLLEALLQSEFDVSIVMTPAGAMVFKDEIDSNIPGSTGRLQAYFTEKFQVGAERIKVYGKDDWYAPLASGSGAPRKMIVCPCSVGCLSAIAVGASNNLLERAADVVIKERGQLVLVVREMPLSAIHLQHMLTLSQLGVTIMPASPGFYFNPNSVQDIVDFVVGRILDQLGISHTVLPRWGE